MTSFPRLSSVSSFSSASSEGTAQLNGRRTRRRFTREQLITLKAKFRATPHPTREERDAIAKQINMNPRSVTIWFQNRRQTERRVAFSDATNHPSQARVLLRTQSLPVTLPQKNGLSPALSSSRPALVTAPARPNLDRVASWSELPTTRPQTPPPRHRTNASGHSAIWENMLSSPVQPESAVASPMALSRDYVAIYKGPSRKSLEWACAAARIADKTARYIPMHADPIREGDETDLEVMTEEEAENGITTPEDSVRSAGMIRSCSRNSVGAKVKLGDVEASRVRTLENDDVMAAALALCGLSRGF